MAETEKWLLAAGFWKPEDCQWQQFMPFKKRTGSVGRGLLKKF
jgi:hypothetical protein